MDIITLQLQESLLRLDITVLRQQTSLQQDTGLVKTYGLAKGGPQNHLLNQSKENTRI